MSNKFKTSSTWNEKNRPGGWFFSKRGGALKFQDPSWREICSVSVHTGVLHVNPVLQTMVGGINSDEFWDIYYERLNATWALGIDYAPPCYDAMWSAGLVLNRTVAKMEERGRSPATYTSQYWTFTTSSWSGIHYSDEGPTELTRVICTIVCLQILGIKLAILKSVDILMQRYSNFRVLNHKILSHIIIKKST